MRIRLLQTGEAAQVLEPDFSGKSILLKREVYDYLEKEGKLNDLQNMNFIIDFDQNLWEISGIPPVGKPGTIASVVFSKRGALSKTDNETFLCSL
jgi:hypothetical protein